MALTVDTGIIELLRIDDAARAASRSLGTVAVVSGYYDGKVWRVASQGRTGTGRTIQAAIARMEEVES